MSRLDQEVEKAIALLSLPTLVEQIVAIREKINSFDSCEEDKLIVKAILIDPTITAWIKENKTEILRHCQ